MYGQEGYHGRNRFRYSSSGTNLIAAEVEAKTLKKAERIAEAPSQSWTTWSSGWVPLTSNNLPEGGMN
jgi:hypothetical protein